MTLYLAIDAGGTKTRCLLADETRMLARAETGTVKLMRVAEAEADVRLRTMLDEVAAGAGVLLDQVARTCFGLAGSRSESVQRWAKGAIAAAGVGGEISICGDEEIALDAAFHGGPGILLIAGTGSHCVGRASDSALHSAGGWGPVLGDEGSGYWIGLEAVRAALRAKDQENGGDAAGLLLEVWRVFGVESLGELVALGNLRVPCKAMSPPDFALLAPVVARCAETGNALARSILRRAGEELAAQVVLVHRRMTCAAPPAALIEVAYTGSVLEQIGLVREVFVAQVTEALHGTKVRDKPVDPLDGALWRARRD